MASHQNDCISDLKETNIGRLWLRKKKKKAPGQGIRISKLVQDKTTSNFQHSGKQECK